MVVWNLRRWKRRTQRRKWQGRGKRVRKGPRGGEGSRKRIRFPEAVLDMREDRSQVSGDVVGDVEQQAGVDAVTMREEPWIEMPKEQGWQRPKKMTHEKVNFMQEYSGPLKISTGCVEECRVEESRRPVQRTLDAWMPRRSGVTVKNRF